MLTAVLRVHWYPPNASSLNFVSYIKDSIKSATILDEMNEKYRDEHTIAPKKNWVLSMGVGFLTNMTFKPKNLSKPKTQTQTKPE